MTNCRGECDACELFYHKADCLAGRGDDHFVALTVDKARELLVESGQSKDVKRQLKEFIVRNVGGKNADEYDSMKLVRRRLITDHEIQLAEYDQLMDSKLNEFVTTSDSMWESIKTKLKSFAGEVK